MAEYIERSVLDDFKDDLMSRFIVLCFGNDYNKLQLLTIGNVIDEFYEKHSTKPAADVVEVRHGEWVEQIETPNWLDDDVEVYYKCSICGCYNWGESAYCPNCGAKMDGKGEG